MALPPKIVNVLKDATVVVRIVFAIILLAISLLYTISIFSQVLFTIDIHKRFRYYVSMNKKLGIFILVIGLFLSVFNHEAFHYIMHRENITSVKIFPNWNTIMKIDFKTNKKYDALPEEIIAYSITGVTFATATYLAMPKLVGNKK